jgi:hypothetical protein
MSPSRARARAAAVLSLRRARWAISGCFEMGADASGSSLPVLVRALRESGLRVRALAGWDRAS